MMASFVATTRIDPRHRFLLQLNVSNSSQYPFLIGALNTARPFWCRLAVIASMVVIWSSVTDEACCGNPHRGAPPWIGRKTTVSWVGMLHRVWLTDQLAGTLATRPWKPTGRQPAGTSVRPAG